MPDFINELKSSTYKKEIVDELQRLVKEMPAYTELSFFIKNARDHYLFDLEKASHDIVVIGSSIPNELVYVTKKFCWVLGGSRVSSMWADDVVPRDTDPVSRSSLGYMKTGFADRSLILIPLVSDSTRKLAYILKSMGLKVHTFHFPPIKDTASLVEWERQYEACRSEIALHLKKPLTKTLLEKSKEEVRRAKNLIYDFQESSEGVISGTVRMFIANSYYCTNEFSEWCDQLESLTARIKKGKRVQNNGRSKVLLLGSPIYFPNYKVPFLIEEVGLEIGLQADYTALSINDGRLLGQGQKEIASGTFYLNDASPAYVKNNSLYEQVLRIVKEKQIDGIVYHVLKGQIEYDFELGRFEDLFEKMDIPVFRLETDYNYQDVEQLRIRLEAFSEVLAQRKYGKGTVAI